MRLDIGTIIVGIIVIIVILTSGIMAGLGALLYALLLALASLTSLIPIAGPVIFYLIVRFSIEPFIVQFIVLGWATTLIFWLFMVGSIIVSAVATFALLMFLRG